MSDRSKVEASNKYRLHTNEECKQYFHANTTGHSEVGTSYNPFKGKYKKKFPVVTAIVLACFILTSSISQILVLSSSVKEFLSFVMVKDAYGTGGGGGDSGIETFGLNSGWSSPSPGTSGIDGTPSSDAEIADPSATYRDDSGDDPGDPAAITGGDPAAITGGDPAAITGGDPAGTYRDDSGDDPGDPAAITGGDPAGTYGDDDGTGFGGGYSVPGWIDPSRYAERCSNCVARVPIGEGSVTVGSQPTNERPSSSADRERGPEPGSSGGNSGGGGGEGTTTPAPSGANSGSGGATGEGPARSNDAVAGGIGIGSLDSGSGGNDRLVQVARMATQGLTHNAMGAFGVPSELLGLGHPVGAQARVFQAAQIANQLAHANQLREGLTNELWTRVFNEAARLNGGPLSFGVPRAVQWGGGVPDYVIPTGSNAGALARFVGHLGTASNVLGALSFVAAIGEAADTGVIQYWRSHSGWNIAAEVIGGLSSVVGLVALGVTLPVWATTAAAIGSITAATIGVGELIYTLSSSSPEHRDSVNPQGEQGPVIEICNPCT